MPNSHRRRATRVQRLPDLTLTTRVLLLLVAAFLIPALGLAIGTVGAEIASRAAAEQAAAEYPVAHPSPAQAVTLADTINQLPALGAEWRWAELDSRPACGMAILRARIVLLDPGMGCDLTATIRHEWAHIAQVHYYGGDSTPSGTLVSDQVDPDTGRNYELDVQEIVADCVSYLLTDEAGTAQPGRSYLPRLGGCPPEQLALAREVIEHAGVRLTEGTATPLSESGSAVAWVYRDERRKAGAR